MKYIKYFLKNSINQYLFSLIIFLTNFYYSINDIATGKFPFTKKLNNGNYIVLSSTNILIVDSTYTEILSTPISFSPELFNGQDDIGSTTVSQFLEGDEYIISIIKQKLIIFSKTGVYLQETDLSFIDTKASCSVIPNGKADNSYIFSIIYASECTGINCKILNFKQCSFNSFSNKIIIPSNTSFSFDVRDQALDEFYSYFTCDIMKNNTNNYIACFYGNSGYMVCSIFDYFDYQISNYNVNSLGDNNGGQLFNIL